MKTVNTHEAKTQLSALLALVEEKGETVLICRHGRPVAELRTARTESTPNPLTLHKELSGKILYNPMEPASEEEWPASAR